MRCISRSLQYALRDEGIPPISHPRSPDIPPINATWHFTISSSAILRSAAFAWSFFVAFWATYKTNIQLNPYSTGIPLHARRGQGIAHTRNKCANSPKCCSTTVFGRFHIQMTNSRLASPLLLPMRYSDTRVPPKDKKKIPQSIIFECSPLRQVTL